MNKFRELLLGNLPIKILSFSIAVVFWFITMNVNNPVVEKDITLSLDLKNEYLITDKNFVIVNQDELTNTNIQVKIRGNRNDIESPRRYPNAITAYVDLSTIDLTNEAILGQTISATVIISNNYPDTFTIVSTYPLTVLLSVDVVETKTIPLYANVSGTPKTSYVLSGNAILDKSSITITGPRNTLDLISKAIVPLNVEGATLDIEQTISPIVVDENNNNISDSVYSGLEPVNVLQKIAKATTVEIISPSLVGTLPSGRTLVEYTIDKQFIDVLADESNPNLSFNPIILDPIDISIVTETQHFEENITQKLTDAGLTAKDSDQAIVTTTLIIEQDTKLTVDVPLEQIEFSNVDYSYFVMNDENLKINISGPSSAIENITAENIDLYCELPLIPEKNEFVGVVEVTLPEGVSLTEVPLLHIVIEGYDELG